MSRKVNASGNSPGLVQIQNYKKADFTAWIESDLSGYSDIASEYKEAREFYENVQIPPTSKSTVEYVQENLITDLINGMVGRIVGGRILPYITGGDKIGAAVRELVMDIIERNKFMTKHVEPITNLFYCEGLAGISVIYNPYRLSQYGIGMPEIYTMLPGEFLLDANSKGFMREDDLRRTLVKRVLVEYAQKKFPDIANQIKSTSRTRTGTTGETEDWCEIYTIEFRVPDIITINELPDGNLKTKLLDGYDSTTKIEVENYYQTEMVNKLEMGSEPVLTGFNRFRIIPVIHTPRFETKTYPFAMSMLMKGKQDQINVTGTVALDAVKSDIKNLIILANADPDLEDKYRREAGKTNGVIVMEGPESRFYQAERKGISPAVLQWYEWQRRSFDEVSGRYAPEKGAVEGDLSGKAIGLLQTQGIVPEQTKKLHLEYAFTEMVMVILECVGHKMNKQKFNITRNIDGKEEKIYFNTPMKEISKLTGEDKINVIINNVVNDLTKVDIDEIDLGIKIEMDSMGRDAMEANKAIVARKTGLLSRIDTTKKIYPEEWRELFQNMEKESAAMALLSKIMQLAPEQINALAKQAQGVDDFIQYVENLSGNNGKTQVSPVKDNSLPAGY